MLNRLKLLAVVAMILGAILELAAAGLASAAEPGWSVVDPLSPP